MRLFSSHPLASESAPCFSSHQIGLDALAQSTSQELSNVATLTAMATGSLFGQLGHAGFLAMGARSSRCFPAIRLVSSGIALGAETLGFETAHRGVEALSRSSHPNLWKWNGIGGWREGLASTFITIGSLKVFGRAAQNQHFLLQHFSSDLGMVAGQNTLGLLGWAPAPQGNFLEQLAHAEATRLQLAAMGQFTRRLLPALSLLERNLGLSIQASSLKSRPEMLPEMSGNNDHDGKTVMDAEIPLRMAAAKDAARARNIERLWRDPSTVIHTDELKWYAQYRYANIIPLGEEGTYLMPCDSHFVEIREELIRRGVNVTQLMMAGFAAAPARGDSSQYARVIDLEELHIEFDRLGNQPSPGESNTQAVPPEGIFQMLGEPKQAQSPDLNPPPSALARIAPTPPEPRGWSLKGLLAATIGRLFTSSSSSTPPSSTPSLHFRGAFVFDPKQNAYRCRLPRGSFVTKLGRGWTADHRITGDPQLSRIHLSIHRRTESTSVAYTLTAHSLVVVHRSNGGMPDTYDHGQTAWLNPGDILRLTPRISLIFDPEE